VNTSQFDGESLSVIKSVMKEVNADRLPVLGKEGRFLGLIDSTGLLGTIVKKERAGLGEKSGEKTNLGMVEVSALLRKDVLKVDPETELNELVRLMCEKNNNIAVVEDGDKFAGMITIKDIFKFIGQSMETVHISISGLENEDDFIKGKINGRINNTVRKLIKVLKINYAVVHFETYKKEGGRRKYSVQGRFSTNKGNFHASESDWDPTKAMKNLLGKIEREIEKKLGKERNR